MMILLVRPPAVTSQWPALPFNIRVEPQELHRALPRTVRIGGVLQFSIKYPRDADQINWAINTCFHERAEKGRSFCFAKCFWQYTGLYDEIKKSISVSAVAMQFTRQGFAVPRNINLLTTHTGIERDHCDVLREKSLSFIGANAGLFKKAFYTDEELIEKWYRDNTGKVKALGQRASKFCNMKFHGSCKVDCRYYYYRLIDEDHKFLNYRKLTVAGISDKQVSQCRKKVEKDQGCSLAENFKMCLEAENKTSWKAEEDYLDEVSAKYHYAEICSRMWIWCLYSPQDITYLE
ncbi:hypothetical protein DMENIID0001_148280 [Sergentomyia squamirostris]